MQPVTQAQAPIKPASGGRTGYNSRTADKFVVRLTDGLRERVQVYARSQFCSMNSFILKAVIKEVEHLDSLDGKEPAPGDVTAVEPTGNETIDESLVLRLERAVAALERLGSGRLQ
ncbi:Arc family DNA-binding protein [Pseudomonas sp. PNPG3]|uniref:Arc family DNA-binding protein n=1 Tax=Pseudomonas sp. PNPG3 TaxID=2919497 RepID=UPI001FFCCFBE|nr:Arc family DNA-binding protein [Pseudomonas sp. PNPG3]MCK2122064.1 Arc family DNA-binding protein [Pseudomonas sp. PNPG3]